jgi:plasmid maintenance system antidote protein VapI
MESGRLQLKAWIKRRHSTQRETANYLGWHETYVSQLITGARVPELDNAIKIERFTGIPVEAWMSTEQDRNAAPVGPVSPEQSNTQA